MLKARYYNELFERALEKWEKYNREYRTLIPEYEKWLAKKIAKGILPVSRIPEGDLLQFPKIDFLKIANKDEAEEYLLCISEYELQALVRKLDLYDYNHVRRTLLAKIDDFKQQIRLRDCIKSNLAIPPEACIPPNRPCHTNRRTWPDYIVKINWR